jgi:periplasmic divalent cation tolerance protein
MYVVIFTTVGNKKEARRVAQAVLQKKLAACVNILDNLESVFWWQGKIDAAKEVLLMIKSKKRLLPKVIKLIKSRHSYEVPEIIALPIIAANPDYLRWIDDAVRKSR